MSSRRLVLPVARAMAIAALAVVGVSGCGSPSSGRYGESLAGSDSVQRRSQTIWFADGADRSPSARLVILGDSLTAGLGVAPDEAYPAQLQARLDAAGYDLEVFNAGVSGDTTAGALRRLAWVLDGDVEFVIVALGGNDGLRGLPIDQMRDNLREIIVRVKERGVPVLLTGMEAPPNFGPSYTEAFRNVFIQLAREHELVFVPFLLEGVAGVPRLNQDDGIHPNAAGAARVAEHLWPAVELLVTSRPHGAEQ